MGGRSGGSTRVLAIVLLATVGYCERVDAQEEECLTSKDPCSQSKTGLLDMALEPLTSHSFIFGDESEASVFEKEIYEVIPRDVKFFGPLNFTSNIIFRMMESIVAIENDKLGEPAVHGEDYYLVKRVKGKDGEWWSGRVPDAFNNASAVYRWFRKGFTLVLNNADSRHVQLAALANGLEDQLGYMVQLNAYLTPPTSQGFEVHWDPMETLIIQLEGKKTWSVYNPIIELPRPEQRFKPAYKQVNFSSAVEMHMEEGAALYLPRGWLHEATTNHSETRGQHSLHLTIGIEAQFVTWEQVMHSLLTISARTQPVALTAVHRSSSGASVSGKALLHWAIRGAALRSSLFRRALLPPRPHGAVDAQKLEEHATCRTCVDEIRSQLHMASVRLAVDTLNGKPDAQLKAQVGADEAGAFEDAEAREPLLTGGAAGVLERAAAFYVASAPDTCQAAIVYVRDGAQVELRRRQAMRKRRLAVHGMPCSPAPVVTAAAA